MRLRGWEGSDMVSQVHEEREVRGELEVDEVVGELMASRGLFGK